MHVGQPHGDGLPQTEAPPRTHADEFLTVRIVLEPVVAERRLMFYFCKSIIYN